MTPEHRLDQILQDVLARTAAERDSYLEEVCEGDEQLRRDVLASLESRRQSGGFTTNPMPQQEIPGYTLKPGDFVGPYRIVRVLGRGGMGDVYLAEHVGQNREVAFKILPDEFLGDGQRVQRFRQEARAVIALNHPNIVTVYDIGAAESGYFISTEFVEGETLRGRLNHDRLSPLQAIEIAEQIAGALAYAHDKGVIHRDIKPENIMLRPDGYVKVLDFGLAKLTEPATPASTEESLHASTLTLLDTSPGIVMGTVQYMSPEQARGLPVDGRTDIWSLGVVLYEMIAGRPAFEALSKNEIVAAILGSEPLPLARFAPDVPHELERIVIRSLRKDRDERYQVIKDLLLDLKNLRKEIELDAKLERSSLRESDEEFSRGIGQRAASRTAAISARQSTPDEALSEWKPRLKFLAGLVVLLALAIIFYKVVLQRSVPRSAFSAIQIARLTSTGKSKLAAISPDGKVVVHVTDEAGEQALWIRQVATTNMVQIVAPAEVDFSGLTFSRW
jgi:serine/threonine protein kinase